MSFCDDISGYGSNKMFDLWQKLELAAELESDLRDTVDWGKKWTYWKKDYKCYFKKGNVVE